MSKYYTPELEEFHVGFEYEYFYREKWHKHNLDGSPIVHSELDEFSDDLMKLAHAICRVKYLDREDIESLWGKINEWVISKSGGSYRLILHTRLNLPFERTITIEMKNHVRDGSGDYTVLPVLYRIKVKNKSELKKLMKQIGYKSKGI